MRVRKYSSIFFKSQSNLAKLEMNLNIHVCNYLHTLAFIPKMCNNIMAKQFCHICNDKAERCFKINDTLEYAMLKMEPKCPSCGKSLIK